jgi:ABC-type xylose transport system permease subunit
VIVIQNNTINNVANYFFSDTGGWIIAGVVGTGYVLVVLRSFLSRRRHGMSRGTGLIATGKVIGPTVLVSLAVYWSNSDPRRGAA